jgi:hypothetical protein
MTQSPGDPSQFQTQPWIPAQPQYGQPPAPGQQPPPPAAYGQPPAYGPPPSAPPAYGPPPSAPPAYGPPASAAPAYGPPPAYGQPQFGYSAYGQTPPPRNRMPLIVGIVAGVLVIFVIVVIGVVIAKNNASDTPSANGPATNQPTATTGATDTTTTPPVTDTNGGGGGGGQQNLTPGQSIVVTDSSGTMSVTVNSVKYRTTGCTSDDLGLSNPDAGNAYIVIEVTYNVTKGTGSYNPFDWSVVDGAGNESSDLGFFAGCKPDLSSGNNLSGKRHGLVVIEVPKAVTHGQVVYSPGFQDSTASWKF